MEHYEKQVADLTAKVKELMKEKVSLESRNTLLEKVVKLKAADSADSGDSGTSVIHIFWIASFFSYSFSCSEPPFTVLIPCFFILFKFSILAQEI